MSKVEASNCLVSREDRELPPDLLGGPSRPLELVSRSTRPRELAREE